SQEPRRPLLREDERQTRNAIPHGEQGRQPRGPLHRFSEERGRKQEVDEPLGELGGRKPAEDLRLHRPSHAGVVGRSCSNWLDGLFSRILQGEDEWLACLSLEDEGGSSNAHLHFRRTGRRCRRKSGSKDIPGLPPEQRGSEDDRKDSRYSAL